MPDIVGCPTAVEISAALDIIKRAEKFLLARAKATGLPVSSVSIYESGGEMRISIEAYKNRIFLGSRGRRDVGNASAYSFARFDQVIDEAATAYKAKKEKA